MIDLGTYARLDATALAMLVREHAVTPAELASLAFAAVEATQPHVGAVAEFYSDRLNTANVIRDDQPFPGIPIS